MLLCSVWQPKAQIILVLYLSCLCSWRHILVFISTHQLSWRSSINTTNLMPSTNMQLTESIKWFLILHWWRTMSRIVWNLERYEMLPNTEKVNQENHKRIQANISFFAADNKWKTPLEILLSTDKCSRWSDPDRWLRSDRVQTHTRWCWQSNFLLQNKGRNIRLETLSGTSGLLPFTDQQTLDDSGRCIQLNLQRSTPSQIPSKMDRTAQNTLHSHKALQCTRWYQSHSLLLHSLEK